LQQRAATLEANDHKTLSHANATSAATAPRAAGRFQYAGGDNPLPGYTIKRGVGQGGFGEIYYAVSDAGKDVALKLIRRNLEVELRGIRQCLNLKHPHLLALFDIREDTRGDSWVVMEYVADQSLEDFLANQPKGLPPEDALKWIHGIGLGVAYLHERGIVHRDLKPGNIFCDEGVVKVGDYGLSKFISCSRRSGHTESIGTVHYMAPEVANGRYGKEIDVYAMGVMLYELLTGRVPFEGESVGEVLMKHLTAKPDVSMLPEPYRGVIARAMEKDPALRFASASEMLAALPSPASDSLLFRSPMRADGEPAAPNSSGQPNTTALPNQDVVVAATLVREDPIIRGVKQNWFKFRNAFHEQPVNIKILLCLPLIYVLIVCPYVQGVVIVFSICYGVYRLIWTLMNPKGDSGAAVASRFNLSNPSAAKATHTTMPYRPLRNPAEALPAYLRKSLRERLADLLGAMLGCSLVAAVMCVVVLVIEMYQRGDRRIPQPEQFAWLWGTSVLGAWAVLVPAKIWERRSGDTMFRRFVMMVIGMGVGVAAFFLSQMLLVGLPTDAILSDFRVGIPTGFYGIDGQPLLLAYVASFGTMFAVIRWWRQALPTRSTRLSLWTLFWTVVIAAGVTIAWQFPQPWLLMTAGTVSVSVQLASSSSASAKSLRKES
jgi:serine/threonine protein kinase